MPWGKLQGLRFRWIIGDDIGDNGCKLVAPSWIGPARDIGPSEALSDIRQPVEAVGECAIVEELFPAEALGATASQSVDAFIEQIKGHDMLVRILGKRNKGAW